MQLNEAVIANWLFFMYVCICNAITDKQIRKAAKAGITDFRALQAELGVATGCGSCKETASGILAEYHDRRTAAQPQVYVPAMA